jgi:hypothetical protein
MPFPFGVLRRAPLSIRSPPTPKIRRGSTKPLDYGAFWMTQNGSPPTLSEPVLSGPALMGTEKFTTPLPVPAPRSVITSQPPMLDATAVQLHVERVAMPTAP